MANSFVRRLKHLLQGGIEDFLEIDGDANAGAERERRAAETLAKARAVLGQIIAGIHRLEKERADLAAESQGDDRAAEAAMLDGDESRARSLVARKVARERRLHDISGRIDALTRQQGEIEEWLRALENESDGTAADAERLTLLEALLADEPHTRH